MSTICRSESRSPIAIIGLACRFPGDASNPSEFWNLLKNGRSTFSPTTGRYNADAFYHPESKNRQNVLPTRGGHFLKQDPYVFDAAFFNITAAEAMALDPKQRLALEVAYEALENAGLPLQKVAGTQTACYMGSAMGDYSSAVERDFAQFPKYHLLGTSEEMISNRISHFLDIHGPSATVQTACSSSHVATHLACQSLQSGESNMAIAGGVGLILTPDGTMYLNNLGFLSPFGHSKAFDENAGGYGRGEGCGILVLKRLDDAIRDGDNVRAIIRASGVNSDGWTQGVTMPSGDAQAALIKHVYESNGLEYGSTQYVEAHGTGTKAGDPVEAGAIYHTIGQCSGRKKLWIGSVKPNIGHLEAAAGMASIIKGVLAMENSLIPPNIHLSKINPAIPLDKWNMAVPTKLTPWPACQTKRMSVSGFGMGGTNAHFVMEEGPLSRNIVKHSYIIRKRLFVFSSNDQAGFKRLRGTLVKHLEHQGPAASSPEYLANLAHTLSIARSGLSWKDTIIAESAVELREQLEATLGQNATRAYRSRSPPRIGFVFTGQGAQWARMGIEMLERPAFKESVFKSDCFLKEMGCDWDTATELARKHGGSRLSSAEISQPICTVLQIALVDELQSWGISPSKVVGHSSGEIAAAYSIGALSQRDALAAAFFRGKAAAGLKRRKGSVAMVGMMAVGCSRMEADKLIADTKLQATVACVNSPSSITISGDTVALERLQEILTERKVFARLLKVDVAYHSSHMHSCSAEYAAAIDSIESYPAKGKTMVSSVTGSEVDPELLGPYYWVRNLISPVLFEHAIRRMVSPDGENNEIDLLIELGPHSTLGGPIEQIMSHYGIKNIEYKSMLTRGESALDTALRLAADLFHLSVAIDVSKVNGDSNCRLLTHLPPYPWNHSQNFRADSRIQREMAYQSSPTRSLIGLPLPKLDESERVWRSFIRLDEEPWLRDHTVGTTVVFPGAGMVSIVLEVAQQMVDQGKLARTFKLRDVSFLAAMTLPEGMAIEVTTHMRPHLISTSGSTPAAWWEFTVSSCIGSSGQLRNNCRGLISITYEEQRSAAMIHEDASIEAAHIADYHRILLECPKTCSKVAFYDGMARASFRYGEIFQGVENCHPGPGISAFEVKFVDIGETFSRGQLSRPFFINAATLDAMFQGTLGSTCTNNNSSNFSLAKPYLPAAIGELEISVRMPADVGCILPGFCRSQRHSLNEMSSNIIILDSSLSQVLMSVADLRLAEVEMEESSKPDGGIGIADVDLADITSEIHWNYALDVIEPTKISQVVSGKTPNEKLIDLVRMLIHQRPESNVVELVERFELLHNATMSKLSEKAILPNQIRYAILNSVDESFTPDNQERVFGKPFALNALDSESGMEKGLADLLILPNQISYNLDNQSGRVLERIIQLAKPEALLLLVGDATSDKEHIVPLTLKDKGFTLVYSIPAGNEYIALYSSSSKEMQKLERLTNGTHAKEAVIILEPSALSAQGQTFSKSLHAILENQGYPVLTVSGLVGVPEGKSYISLLELEKPMLENLSEFEFQCVRSLMLSCERLLWITCGDNPSLGMIDGLLRVVRSEMASVKAQVLHLSSEGFQKGPSLAARIIASENLDNEFRERDGLLQVSRAYKSLRENDRVRDHLYDATRIKELKFGKESSNLPSLRLNIGKPGLLDTLHFAPDESTLRTPLSDNEVEIQVKATGLNFRDIMASMGLVPVRGLGQEASGIVLRAGSNAARSFKPGDRVSTLSLGGTHATRTRCDFRVTMKIPETMSFEEAAAVPAVHATAYFALVKLARLRRGQTVLIHAAAGGVGQAAVQLSIHLGLVVYATVGTDDKRELIMEQYGIPEENIFHSRDSSFVKGIKRTTGGRGVDCVLNSLSGELLRVSFDCLATFGTFIEIGLRDITNNMRLDMRPFSKSTTFTFINMHTLLEQDADTANQIVSEVFKLLQKGILRAPYPMVVYPVGQLEEAFRTMQQGRHRGKLVLSFTGETCKAPVLCKAKDSLKLDPNATYLLVGGLGGLGRSLAMELVASGARNIAFFSRSSDAKPEAKAAVDQLRIHGAMVKLYSGDVADEDSFLAAMKQCSDELPPIKGVVQMAMVLRDVLLEKMTYDEWKVPLQSKVAGTWNLHKYFDHERPLDFLIFCSSISGIIGNVGQAQYAAGNTYQDRLAEYRRSQGLKAVSVNLGMMRDVGVIAETGMNALKLWEDVLGIREPAFHALMKSLINAQQQNGGVSEDTCPVQVCTGLGSADILTTHNLPQPGYFKDPRFGPLAVSNRSSTAGNTSTAEGPAASLASRLSDANNGKDPGGPARVITDALVKKTAEILRIPPSEVDPSQPMYHYGVDSLVALEVRNWITREMKANMPLLDILAAVPMQSFAERILKKSKLVMGSA
ncbi:reducing polyketide synthase [Lojkania enalia]|uniref:Reducing polyketide synthase n=1 Tax=Lojkania enalia TaxID=147567 RepID=A0A9P4JW79_9PLEO|nr:reducing polyketide synthase [Didymosphaeria enalia]